MDKDPRKLAEKINELIRIPQDALFPEGITGPNSDPPVHIRRSNFYLEKNIIVIFTGVYKSDSVRAVVRELMDIFFI